MKIPPLNKHSQSLCHVDDSDDCKYKKDKSLGILCRQFIELFVAWKPKISLEEAAR
jgi:hypothetical protein